MKKRILVVDDDQAIRESLNNLLRDAGYEVTLARDGGEAELKFTSQTFDLILLDLQLPEQDGWDVLGLVNSQAPLLPIIIITGLRAQLDTTIIPGAAAFLEKPVDVPLLLKIIEKLMNETPEKRLGRLKMALEDRSRSPRRPGWNSPALPVEAR